MNQPTRIALRLCGLVLVLGSLAGMAYILAVGPDDIGKQMGRECNYNDTHDRPGWCTWRHALDLLKDLPWATLVGGVFLVLARPEGRQGPLQITGMAAVAATILLAFVGTHVYSAGYRTSVHVRMAKEIVEGAERNPYVTGRSVKPTAAPAKKARAAVPHGLGGGSLLRAGKLATAMRQLRRAAPAGARLTSLRIAPDRVDAEVLAGGRTLRLRRAWDGPASVVSTAPATAADRPLVAFGAVDTTAPQRIARTAGELEYLVLIDVAGLRWNAFRTGGGGMVAATPGGRPLA